MDKSVRINLLLTLGMIMYVNGVHGEVLLLKWAGLIAISVWASLAYVA